MKVIGLTGLARSGKDTVANYLVEKYSFKHFDFFRDTIIPELEKRNLEITKQNGSQLAGKLRQEFGLGVIAEKLIERIAKENFSSLKGVVITGFRDTKEVKLLKKKFPKLMLILIEAEAEKRFDRRDEKTPANREIFFQRDEFDSKTWGMQKVFKLAKLKIENSGSKEDLYKKIDSILKKI